MRNRAKYTMACMILLSAANSTRADLVSSTLPASRSVQVNGAATAFATVINTGQDAGTQCRIELGSAIAANFFYQTTESTTNALTGTQDSPVTIAAGGSQSFIFGITPTAVLDPQYVELNFVCDNISAATSFDGLNTLYLSASTSAVADIIGIALTTTSDGIAVLPADAGFGAFAAATANVGATANLTVRVRASFSLDGTALLCETNPSTGACLEPPSASVRIQIAANGTNTFSVFVASNVEVPADYAANRVFLEFLDDSGQVRGSTSVAVVRGGDEADFHAPAPIEENLLLPRSVTWTELSDTPANLTRFSIGPDGTTDLVVLTDSDSGVNADLSVDSGMASEATTTNDRLLRSIFKFIENSDGSFRIVSTKHSNYALDVDASSGTTQKLILRDFRSGSLDTDTAGYLTFESVTGSPATLQATGRRIAVPGSDLGSDFVVDATWTTQQVALVDGSLELTSGTGTSMKLYVPPIDFDTPFDFNPDGVELVDNAEATPIVTEDRLTEIVSRVVDKYQPQVAVAGVDAGTTAASAAMIAEIETSLAAEDAQMRYPAAFYLAIRDGFLSRTLQSSDSTDGVLGQLTMPNVYFTNETDADGIHHPFMVIAGFGLPDSLALLADVAKPPGIGAGLEYPDQTVTRSFHKEAFLTKIPMRDYGEVESLTENVMNADLASDASVTEFTHHNRASVSATGIALDGVMVYPSFNNAVHFSQLEAELSTHGMHSGGGLGVHYHADGHSAKGDGLNLYNDADYEGHTHPPIVSIGLDGVAGYGFYREGDTTSDGVSIALDEYGGHEHGDYAYHYHSFTTEEVTEIGGGPNPTGGVAYTAHKLPPLGAWRGRINDIPEFWGDRDPDVVGGNSVYLGTLEAD